MELRRCGRCEEHKPLPDFAWRRKAKGQADNYCRACRSAYKREHYLAHRGRYIEQARERKTRVARQRIEYLLGYFRDHPCSDCGEDDPLVLEFDHRGDKEFTIGRALRDRNWEAILDEIAKCEVVCANCHRRRTAVTRGFLRAAVASAEAGDGNRTRPQTLEGSCATTTLRPQGKAANSTGE